MFRGTRLSRRAFTIIELLSVVTIAGLLMSVGFGKMREAVDRAKEVKAVSDLKAMVVAINLRDTVPASLAEIGWAGRLDPWKRPYVYLPFPPSRNGNRPPAGARKDRFLVPINSRYDLYSLGKDGGSVAPLTARASRDDIVVANDGGFIGRASKY